jgi:hypothetical protein
VTEADEYEFVDMMEGLSPEEREKKQKQINKNK